MRTEDKEFFAFLATWITDRVVTAIFETSENWSGVKLCKYSELREQTKVLLQEQPVFNRDTENEKY